jgi:hypothetical protein
MSADSPDEDTSWSAPPPARDAADEPRAGVTNSAAGFLDHFNRIVMMMELIGRLPDLAEDVRNWRPSSLDEYSRSARDGGAIDSYGALSPVARHAFDAVAAGLNTLGSTAVAICENAGGRLSPDEIAACREIGVVMASLLERARALIETVEGSRFSAARSCVDRPLQLKRAG